MDQILIVDDSALARKIIRRCFEIAGYREATFIQAGNGEAALEILRKVKIDIVISDLNMPDMDGRKLLMHIKSSPKLNSVPVIVVTSLTNSSLEKELMEKGAAKVLPKPITPFILKHAIDNIGNEGSYSGKEIDSGVEYIFSKAFSKTFEEMVFEEVVLEGFFKNITTDLSKLMEENPGFWAEISLTAPEMGEFGLWVPGKLLGKIFESTYGKIPESEGNLKDCLGEVLNTLAGRIMAYKNQKKEILFSLPKTGMGKINSESSNSFYGKFTVGDTKIVFSFSKELYQVR
ncbi:MAG: response regulator [Candidatus Riflebacteria bacterium]|nr:response regulator [Candidatus Riflebacteria bacterium]